MSVSNFPNGFPTGVTIREQPIQVLYPGKVFWVNNSSVLAERGIGGSNGNKGTYQQPFSTLAYALTQCTANRGDIIVLMPGHAETVSSATALDLNVAGVCILGLGTGSKRPSLTLDTATTSLITVSAANVTVKNLQIIPNFAAIVTAFTLTTANYFTLEDCRIGTGTSLNFLSVVTTDTTSNHADGMSLTGNRWIEQDTGTLSLLRMTGTNDNVLIKDNHVNLGVNNNVPALVNVSNGKIATALRMLDNLVYRLNTDTATGAILFHTNGSTNTGIVARNFAQHADTAAELLITASSGLGVFNNYASGVAGASGYLLPAADS